MENSAALWKSLMKRIKRIGPTMDPWRTPVFLVLSEDLALLKLVCYFLSTRNDLNDPFV